jgi:hypothetical protein
MTRFSKLPQIKSNSRRRGIIRSQQAYLILMCYAIERKTIRGDELAKKLKYKQWTPSIKKHILGRLDKWCENKRLPKLTILTVEKVSGRPHNANQIKRYQSHRERVYDADWFDIIPPTFEELQNINID